MTKNNYFINNKKASYKSVKRLLVGQCIEVGGKDLFRVNKNKYSTLRNKLFDKKYLSIKYCDGSVNRIKINTK